MAINHTIRFENPILRIKAEGEDENLQQVIDYAESIVKSAEENKSRLILCDEQHLKYKLSTIDTFRLAEYVSSYAAQVCKIAIVCNPATLSEGQFYEAVSTNRGMSLKVFTDPEKAEFWLKQNL